LRLGRALQGLSKLDESEVSANAPTRERNEGRKWAGIELPMPAERSVTYEHFTNVRIFPRYKNSISTCVDVTSD
jgi:hypothetical protein